MSDENSTVPDIELADPASTDLPLYLQVSSTLRTAILRGIYPLGSRMPTEEALCQVHNVSRHTVREALRQLRADGLITSRPGSRPVVASQVPRPPETIAGDIGPDFFDYTISTRLEIERMEAITVDPALAKETGLAVGDECLNVRCYRVHVEDGHVTCWNEYLIKSEFALVGRLLHRHVGPLIPLIEDLFQERIVRITRSISAVPMPPEQGARLGVPEGTPTLHVFVRSETAGAKTAMVHRSLHPFAEITYSICRY